MENDIKRNECKILLMQNIDNRWFNIEEYSSSILDNPSYWLNNLLSYKLIDKNYLFKLIMGGYWINAIKYIHNIYNGWSLEKIYSVIKYIYKNNTRFEYMPSDSEILLANDIAKDIKHEDTKYFDKYLNWPMYKIIGDILEFNLTEKEINNVLKKHKYRMKKKNIFNKMK